MLTGHTPFSSRDNLHKLEQLIVENKKTYPHMLSESAKDLIDQLMKNQPEERLGHHSYEDIKHHPFFTDLDWPSLDSGTLQEPFLEIKNHLMQHDLSDTYQATDNSCNEMPKIFGVSYYGCDTYGSLYN